jgi:hypothetical protein
VGLFVGAGYEATHLAWMFFHTSEIRHDRCGCVTRLLLHDRKVHSACVESRRGTGFQPTHAEREFTQATSEGDGWGITRSPASMILQADMYLAPEEGASGQNDLARKEAQSRLSDHAIDPVTDHDQIVDGLLEKAQVGLVFEEVAHRSLVEDAIGLRACGAYGRPLAGVEQSKLDTCAIRGPGHRTTKCIHFSHEVGLADTPDCRIAGHLAKRLDAVADQQGLGTHASGGERSLSAGVATTDDDHIKMVLKTHGVLEGGDKGPRIIRALRLLT